MKLPKLVFLALIALFVSSCDSDRIFDENRSFVNETWHRDSLLEFQINITDTLDVYNIFVHNRISGQYEFSNLYLFVETHLPNHQVIRDTMECLLREPSGQPLGKGFGNIWSNKIPYRMHIRFPFSGTYKVTLEQAMRVDELRYILDAGIRVEKAKI